MDEAVSPGSTIGFTISAHDDDGSNRDAALYWKGTHDLDRSTHSSRP